MLPILGARYFAAAASPLWDKLPSDITNVSPLNCFKKSSPFFSTNHLKLNLFYLHLILYLILDETFIKCF